MDEVVKQEEAEPADVICGDCIGLMNLHQIQRTTPKLFTPTYYKRLALICSHCNKMGKVFMEKINKRQ